MAVVPSKMIALGSPAPDFVLPDVVSDRMVGLGDFAGAPLLVMFLCNHCPYVQHVRREITALDRNYRDTALKIVAINSNDVAAYPADAPPRMRQMAEQEGWSFPFLYDESQRVARAYGATCTPDFFLFDATHALAYRGRLDDSQPGNGRPVTGADLRAAIDAVLAGAKPAREQHPSAGCSIKWKATLS